MSRHLPREDRAGQVLELIAEVPRSGAELIGLLAITPAELALIVHPLWHAKLLQGEATEGCCRRASGMNCKSCRLDRRWCLTRKGASELTY